jgi:hypothetical protein
MHSAAVPFTSNMGTTFSRQQHMRFSNQKSTYLGTHHKQPKGNPRDVAIQKLQICGMTTMLQPETKNHSQKRQPIKQIALHVSEMDVQREPIMLLAQVQLQYDPRYLNNFQPLFFVVDVFTTSNKLGMERSWSNAWHCSEPQNINPTTLPPQ